MKKILTLILAVTICTSILANDQKEKYIILPGSNIYFRVFLFFFPISNKYEFVYSQENNLLITEIVVKKQHVKNEPSTPPIIESDLILRIKDIPLNQAGVFTLPVTIRCNKKVNFKKVNFTIYRKDNILIIKGYMGDLFVKEISDNDYFKNRFNWKFPFYFDLRYQINE